MLVVSRKNGQKIMINDNIIITVVESRNGQCKIAIDASKDVKIYREEIYYQVKLANLIGRNTDVSTAESVSTLFSDEKLKLNDKIESVQDTSEVELEKTNKSKKIIIKKNNNDNV